MPHILVDRLVKTYRIAERDPGLMGAVRGVLRRRYRTVEALSGVSFSLERGELLGFIGPNGAGKSTTIKILAGILRPDGGRVEIDGRDPFADRERHVGRIGVVFGQRTQLWWDLPVGEGAWGHGHRHGGVGRQVRRGARGRLRDGGGLHPGGLGGPGHRRHRWAQGTRGL